MAAARLIVMTQHPDIDDLPAFALRMLNTEKTARIQQHLESCPDCRAVARDYARIADLLLYAAPLCEPPAHLKQQLLDRIAGVTEPSGITVVALQETTL